MSKHAAQSARLTLSSLKNKIIFRKILNSFLHISDTERNITRKLQESCYKKNRVHRCRGNIGIAFCTRARVTKFYTIFFRISVK